jgi:hypothetical protein
MMHSSYFRSTQAESRLSGLRPSYIASNATLSKRRLQCLRAQEAVIIIRAKNPISLHEMSERILYLEAIHTDL